MAQAAPKKKSKALVVTISAVVVVVLGCLGAAVYGAVRVGNNVQAARERATSPFLPSFPAGPLSSPGVSDDDDDGGAVQGPRESTYPVRDEDDLKRVCEGWFYPDSPKVGAGLNPAATFTNDSLDYPLLHHTSLYDVPYSLSKATREAYDAAKPTKARLVACVNLTTVGKTARTCTFEDPKPDKVKLKQATYQFTLYEVATGRKLTDKKVIGEDDECPYVAYVGKDKTIYSGVTGRQLYELLRKYVQK